MSLQDEIPFAHPVARFPVKKRPTLPPSFAAKKEVPTSFTHCSFDLWALKLTYCIQDCWLPREPKSDRADFYSIDKAVPADPLLEGCDSQVEWPACRHHLRIFQITCRPSLTSTRELSCLLIQL